MTEEKLCEYCGHPPVRPTLTCECGTVFKQTHGRQHFCTWRCANTIRKRKQRERQKKQQVRFPW